MECASGLLAWIECHQGLSALLGALGAVAASVVALYLAGESRRERVRTEEIRDLALLLALHSLVKEAGRATDLSFFQLDNEANPIIYPDFGIEMSRIQDMLHQLPLDRMAVHNQIPIVIAAARIASQIGLMLTPPPPRDGRFYLAHRNELSDLSTRSRNISIKLANYIKQLDPAFYARHEYELTRL